MTACPQSPVFSFLPALGRGGPAPFAGPSTALILAPYPTCVQARGLVPATSTIPGCHHHCVCPLGGSPRVSGRCALASGCSYSRSLPESLPSHPTLQLCPGRRPQAVAAGPGVFPTLLLLTEPLQTHLAVLGAPSRVGQRPRMVTAGNSSTLSPKA